MLSDDYSPYCGLTYNKHNRVARAASAPHIVVSAPTRTGTARRILTGRDPASRPLRGVSSKPDLAELVITKRCMGVTGVIDLRPEQTESMARWCATHGHRPHTHHHRRPRSTDRRRNDAGYLWCRVQRRVGRQRRRRRPVGDPSRPAVGVPAVCRQPAGQRAGNALGARRGAKTSAWSIPMMRTPSPRWARRRG